jgi:hypothetical protein
VQAGVVQHYRRIVALDRSAAVLWLEASLDYANVHRGVRHWIAKLVAKRTLRRDVLDTAIERADNCEAHC